MKEEYEALEFEVIELDSADIITESICSDDEFECPNEIPIGG